MATRQAATRAPRAGTAADVASRLHSAAIHLLRRLRREDDASGLSAPRLSALSVLVFGGARTIGELATAEQVRVPTMSRLVAGLEADDLVRRVPGAGDKRIVRVEATPRGKELMLAGQRRRVAALEESIARLSPADRATLLAAIPLVESLAGR